MEKVSVVDLSDVVKNGTVGWVTGLGKALFKDELLEVAFYNGVSGEANNSLHMHNFSTERLLVITGGITVEITDDSEGEIIELGPWQMLTIPPASALRLRHRIVKYKKGTFALNLRNSKEGAIGHLLEDRA